MPLAERRANVVWNGNLAQGNGRLSLTSGVTGTMPVTWASRTERPDGKTSPEELIAAAHASCFAMAFSHTLDQSGHQPQELTINATCAIEPIEGGIKVSTVQLDVSGKVPGLDAAEFERLAHQADQGCPVSNALRGNVDIHVTARLETA